MYIAYYGKSYGHKHRREKNQRLQAFKYLELIIRQGGTDS